MYDSYYFICTFLMAGLGEVLVECVVTPPAMTGAVLKDLQRPSSARLSRGLYVRLVWSAVLVLTAVLMIMAHTSRTSPRGPGFNVPNLSARAPQPRVCILIDYTYFRY